MAVVHDYECPTHGVFEARAPKKCPFKGCAETIVRAFVKPPGLKSERTKHNDRTVRQLAIDYRMSDVKSAREGESQAGYLVRQNPPPEEPRPGAQLLWGDSAQGKTRHNLATALTGGAARSIHGEPVGLRPRDVGATHGPSVASYQADHENLKIAK